MFTGIIQDKVRLLRKSASGKGFIIEVEKPLRESTFEKGESISINGVCLSLEKATHRSLLFYAQTETIKKTTLKRLPSRTILNFERAMKIGDRIGGHLVQGHVDETGKITGMIKKGKSLSFSITVSASLMPFIISKGSIALDGISLTVSSIKRSGFTVDIIPLTCETTNVKESWKTGKTVNVETDAMNRQIHRSVELILSRKK